MLLDHGHRDAREYPIGMVWDECQIVVDRTNASEATRGYVLQMAVSSGMGSKKAHKELQRLIKEWTKNG